MTLLIFINHLAHPGSNIQFLDHEAFYLCLDNRLLVDLIRTDLAYLKSNWKLMGRPTIVLPLLWYLVLHFYVAHALTLTLWLYV